MRKPTRTAQQLQQLLVERIDALPGMAGPRTDAHDFGVIPMYHGNGEEGPNWTVPTRREFHTYRVDVAQVIGQLQKQFDLEE